jgi:Fe(3+) dicitrate transport protein
MLLMLVLTAPMIPDPLFADCDPKSRSAPECVQLEPITIFGRADAARDVAGGASVLTPEDLEEFESTDAIRALRRVPGLSMQLEDGWGLRPNISIRGTATERSSRVTLMEDGVLIAPAPYSAPAAYYFPTFGRIHAVEVLKGPSSITQGPFTVGGAINLVSTPIPGKPGGYLQDEYGSDDTWRVHGWYGGGSERASFLAETHQWQSDGYQHIDRSDDRTGLQKEDYLAKIGFWSDASAALYQSLEIKLQAAEEDSQQTYLGLIDTDFEDGPLRRYGLSAEDEMQNDHQQIVLSWRLESRSGNGFTMTAYDNEFERDWYKTEGIDFDGSASPESFSRTSWSNVIDAINRGEALSGFSADELQAVLHGADTAAGSIQLRNNAREYYSRGVQIVADATVQSGPVAHQLQAGLRYHEDEEDRLQRNDNFQQLTGRLVLNARGLEGNAGNEVNDAQAWAAYVQDRIEYDRWVFSPGLRYENIELSRLRYQTNGLNPSDRSEDSVRDRRSNEVDVWLPGLGVIYALNSSTRLVGGVHRGFATPGNEPGVDPEESINYELGLRHETGRLDLEAMFFFNDYENLVGLCTNASGGDCTPGQAFNGEGVHIPGLEVAMGTAFESAGGWHLPLRLSYTWMDAEFQSSFNSEFFGNVSKGDPVPYIMDHQLWASVGLQRGGWSLALSANYLDSVCTRASCGAYEKTESATLFDLSAHYQVSAQWALYAIVENLSDELHIAAREPYGARPGKPRTVMLGTKFRF